jgi:hypothetical protein
MASFIIARPAIACPRACEFRRVKGPFVPRRSQFNGGAAMNARREHATKLPPARSEKDTPNANSSASSSGPKSSKLTSAGSALEECVGALCLVEVAMHSLEWQEIAFPEQWP